VRVHADGEADQVARSVQATAFTHGSDIYFSQGAYAPASASGQHLLAHELTHVVQQQSGASAGSGAGPTIGRANDPAEEHAEHTADRVVSAMRRQTAHTAALPGAAVGAGFRPGADAPVQRLFGWFKGKKKKKAKGETEKTDPTPTGGETTSGETTGGETTGGETTTDTTTDLAPPKTAWSAPTKRTAKERFEMALGDGTASTGKEQSKTRLTRLRAVVKGMSADEKKTIWEDDDLMESTKVYVGGLDFQMMAAALGMTHTGGTVEHKSGSEVDRLIKKYLGELPHLKDLIDAAVKAGKQADGFIAVLDKENWERVYESEFPSEPIGSTPEKNTNAYTSTKQEQGPIILNKDRGNAGTAVHEGMHRYQNDATNTQLGFNFNEGLTEYFTRRVTSHDDLKIVRDNYKINHQLVSQFLKPCLGSDDVTQETVMAKAYYGGDVATMRKAWMAWRKKAKTETDKETLAQWKGLVADIRAEKWQDAANRCQ
jgi:hypothetical protein